MKRSAKAGALVVVALVLPILALAGWALSSFLSGGGEKKTSPTPSVVDALIEKGKEKLAAVQAAVTPEQAAAIQQGKDNLEAAQFWNWF